MKYVDLQVNGAFGVDFNSDALTEEQFCHACALLKASGVIGFLPTIITDSIATMCDRIRKIVGFVQSNRDSFSIVRGLHVEGPFISREPGFLGTHPAEHVRAASMDDAQRLLDAGNGHVRLMTLAPEQDEGGRVIERLSKAGVVVFAGHTNASYTMLRLAIDHGLRGFTHLGNGCVHQVDRQDNIAQRVLALRDQLLVTLIADGIHVPGWLLKSWLEIIGTGRCMIVSDSISAAGMPPGEYEIGGQPILVDATRRTRHREHGYLAGSASNLADMDVWLSNELKVSSEQREKLVYENANSLLNEW